MPLYTYVDNNTKDYVEVLRDFKDYEDIPTREECKELSMTEEQYDNADWKRVIGGGIQMTRGANWGGSKGNW